MATVPTRTTENVQPSARRDRRATARLAAAAILGGLLVLFAALNSQSVRIHWIVTRTDVPLIVVILGCGLIGAAIAWLFMRRRRSKS